MAQDQARAKILQMIKLYIKCNNNDDQVEAMREMGIDTPGTTEYRPFRAKKELIDGYYANTDGGCFVFFCGMELTVRESIAELDLLLT